MRKVIISAVIAAFSFIGAAPLAEASPMVNRYHNVVGASPVVTVDYYGGSYRKHYRKKHYYKQEYCRWKKVRRYDEYGDVYYERVRVCR